jgi:hypothetical protein
VSKPIEDPAGLPGTDVHDQLGRKVGQVQRVYAHGGEGDAMWVTVEVSGGLFESRTVFLPLARLKDEDGDVHVPYSKQFLEDAPEVEQGDELSEEDDKRLRDYYGVDRGDLELRTDNDDSYAAQVPDDRDEPARALEGD